MQNKGNNQHNTNLFDWYTPNVAFSSLCIVAN